MKKAFALVAVMLALGMSVAFDAEAKRLGGGKSSGMQRQSTPAPANTAAGTPHNQAAPAQAAPSTAPAAAGATAAAAPKRSWMGPIAGLAAGLGLAALASHFGFGEALANMMMMGLLVMAVLLVVGLVLRKRAAGQGPAMAGAGGAAPFPQQAGQAYRSAEPLDRPQDGSMIGSRIGGGLGGLAGAGAENGSIPAGFDTDAFERNAKAQFMGLQAANDAGDVERLRDYLSPEMFDLARADIAERNGAPQQTEVFGLHAQVLAVLEEGGRYVASVRFTGSVRDQRGAVPEDLDEVWHLTKPSTGAGGWLVAGIQQRADGAPAA